MKIQTSKEGGKGFEKPRVAEGLYIAKLKEVKNVKDGQYGKRVSFIYTLKDKNIDLAYLVYIPETATPENKFGKILIAHGIELGATIDTSPLIGTEVRIMVEDYEYEEDKNKKIASTITKVKPLSEVDKD